MQTILITLTLVVALVLVLLVSLLPRSEPAILQDINTSIGKSGYWKLTSQKKIPSSFGKPSLIVRMIFLYDSIL